jgi:hypothetical protein
MRRFFSVFFLTAALVSVTPAGYADGDPMPQAPSQTPFMARQILEGQPSHQEARPQTPPDWKMEQNISETRDGIEQKQRESRENRDKVRSRVEKSWGGVTGPAR